MNADNAKIVAIDGPAGAGKSTVARALGQRLGFFLLDTGAIYRAVALQAEREGIAWSDGKRLGDLAAVLPLRFDAEGRVWLGPNDVSSAIRTPEISQGASTVSAHPEVRSALLQLQRQIASRGGCVVEGRDIGTVVLPNAPCKFFLTATPEVRAKRRFDELTARGIAADYASTLKEQLERDARDSGRDTAPLRQADDAILIDSSALDFNQVLAKLERIARERLRL